MQHPWKGTDHRRGNDARKIHAGVPLVALGRRSHVHRRIPRHFLSQRGTRIPKHRLALVPQPVQVGPQHRFPNDVERGDLEVLGDAERPPVGHGRLGREQRHQLARGRVHQRRGDVAQVADRNDVGPEAHLRKPLGPLNLADAGAGHDGAEGVDAAGRLVEGLSAVLEQVFDLAGVVDEDQRLPEGREEELDDGGLEVAELCAQHLGGVAHALGFGLEAGCVAEETAGRRLVVGDGGVGAAMGCDVV